MLPLVRWRWSGDSGTATVTWFSKVARFLVALAMANLCTWSQIVQINDQPGILNIVKGNPKAL